jgi:hypothetical protein
MFTLEKCLKKKAALPLLMKGKEKKRKEKQTKASVGVNYELLSR